MSIEKKIQAAVAEIAKVADKLPGVVIIHDLRDWSMVWMSESGLKLLGVSLEEVTSLSIEEYHARFFNPEDAKDYVPKLAELMERNDPELYCSFFQQVRFSPQEDWNWHMSSVRILAHDDEGKPLLTIIIAYPIDTMHLVASKADRLLEENNFLRRNFHQFTKLSKREREILKFLALGKTAAETAAELFISLHTVETHRKNIRQKLGTSSFFDLTQYARAFDLI